MTIFILCTFIHSLREEVWSRFLKSCTLAISWKERHIQVHMVWWFLIIFNHAIKIWLLSLRSAWKWTFTWFLILISHLNLWIHPVCVSQPLMLQLGLSKVPVWYQVDSDILKTTPAFLQYWKNHGLIWYPLIGSCFQMSPSVFVWALCEEVQRSLFTSCFSSIENH